MIIHSELSIGAQLWLSMPLFILTIAFASASIMTAFSMRGERWQDRVTSKEWRFRLWVSGTIFLALAGVPGIIIGTTVAFATKGSSEDALSKAVTLSVVAALVVTGLVRGLKSLDKPKGKRGERWISDPDRRAFIDNMIAASAVLTVLGATYQPFVDWIHLFTE